MLRNRAVLPALMLALASKISAQTPAANEGFASAEDGIRLHYRVEGSGSQTVIVPAGLFLHRDLRSLAAGRRVVFYDMRGRGQSDRVDDTTRSPTPNPRL
jgi:pimeloyl-ACP methyl ester carboxylesterase